MFFMQIIEFYYRCLFVNDAYELYSFVKKNEWYFKKLIPEAQEQIRKYYKKLKEEEDGR